MLADVGERLLDHAVGGEVDRGGQGLRRGRGLEVDGESGADEAVDELIEDAQARSRFGGGFRVVGLAQQADRGAQLRKRRAGRLADMRQGLFGLVGPVVHDMGGDPGLDVDQRDVVGDDIVQLAGDAHPLLGDTAAGLLLAGAFGALGALADGVDIGPAAADRVARGRGHPRPGEDRQVLLGVPGVFAEEHRGGGEHDDGQRADAPGGGPVRTGGHGEQGQDGGEGDGGARVAGADDQLDDGERAGGGQDRTGKAAAGDEGGAGECGEHDGGGGQLADAETGAVRAVRIGHRTAQRRHEDHRGQGGVDGERMRTVPAETARAHRVGHDVRHDARCGCGYGVEGGHKRKR